MSIIPTTGSEDRFPLLFEIVPPERGNVEERLEQHADRLEFLFSEAEVDALNLPEIQNESKKSEKGKRRTPFLERLSPREYARLLGDRVDTEFVINRVVVNHTADEHKQWMRETRQEYGINSVIFVGGERSNETYRGMNVPGCNHLFSQKGRRGESTAQPLTDKLSVGNICIPTRRQTILDEPERMYRKQRAGADFFTTQIIAEEESPLSLLKDYSEILENESETPPAIYWSFSPVAEEKDVDFLRWLGVHIPEQTEKKILESVDPVEASIDHARAVWERILAFNSRLPNPLPMGINVSVMGLRNFDNGIQLARELQMMPVAD